MEIPVIESGKEDTWAPAGLEIIDSQFLFGGLRGEALYTGQIRGETIEAFSQRFFQQWGRIRVVRQGPDGWLYLATSNRDGRGQVRAGDDRIIRIKGI